ncbi:MAG: hypothetical protein MZV63_34480 [Marinilabiliales bacterium]|nr:hypothetical protein [Marinilabiliales bacterium]
MGEGASLVLNAIKNRLSLQGRNIAFSPGLREADIPKVRLMEGDRMKISVKTPSKAELDALGVRSWPVWEKEVSTFPWVYDLSEDLLPACRQGYGHHGGRLDCKLRGR